MEFKEVMGLIEDSEEFKGFIRDNPHYYAVHGFNIVEDGNPGPWQVGYYSRDSDRIVIFEYSNDIVLMHPPEEALKKEEYIQRLEIEKLATTHKDAAIILDEFMKENYKYDLPSKNIFLLQNLPDLGHVWNVTVITLNFSVINVKIDASNGQVVKHEKQNLIQWNSDKTK